MAQLSWEGSGHRAGTALGADEMPLLTDSHPALHKSL